MIYKNALIDAMSWLARQSDTIFIGQTTVFPGSYMHGSLRDVPKEKMIEWPVAEEMQMGASLGLSLEGYCVVSIYPRFDFLILAMNQLVNHIDKIRWMSEGKMQPRIIIRTSVGPRKPLDAGPQHTQDHCEAFEKMLTTVNVVRLIRAGMIGPFYRQAYKDKDQRLWLFVEDGNRY